MRPFLHDSTDPPERAAAKAVDDLQAVSRTLIEEIASGGTTSLSDLLDVRAAACADLARLIERGIQFDDSELRQILALQAECEEAIRAAVDDTSRRLRDLAAQRRVRFVYSGGGQTGPPRFVDKRQ